MTIDLDTTDVEVYGRKKRGVAYNYQGQRCGRPHVAAWAETGTVLAADLLPGDADPRPGAAGLLRLLAFCAPTTNSYRRLVPGYEAPVNLVYSMRNRSACIRIPMYSDSPKAKRIEFRCPDAAANPYLAFSAMLMAGLDGIQKGLDAGEPADWDLFEEDRGVAQVPGSLAEALEALEHVGERLEHHGNEGAGHRQPVRPQDAARSHQHLVDRVLRAVVEQDRRMPRQQVDAHDQLRHALVHDEVDRAARLIVALGPDAERALPPGAPTGERLPQPGVRWKPPWNEMAKAFRRP